MLCGCHDYLFELILSKNNTGVKSTSSTIKGQREGKYLKAEEHWPMEEPKIKYLPNYRSFSPALSN